MANRMNRVRALTGGLAAIMIMSNVATSTTYAADPEEVTVAVEQTAAPEAVVPETAKDDEAPSGMQPAPEYAEIEEAQVIEVPAPETTAPEAVVPETVKDDEAPSGMHPAPEYAEAEEAPVIEAPAPVEMGTAKAGNFEENEEPEEKTISKKK